MNSSIARFYGLQVLFNTMMKIKLLYSLCIIAFCNHTCMYLLSLSRNLAVLLFEDKATKASMTVAAGETKKLTIREKSQLKTCFDGFLSCCHSTKVDFEN